MLKLSDSVIDCGMKYSNAERKDFFDALIMFSYFKKLPDNLEKQKWVNDFRFFMSDLQREYEYGLLSE